MSDNTNKYKPVPVQAAKDIAHAYDKCMVIVLSYDRTHNSIHTTTYGREPIEKEAAADAGDRCTKLLYGDDWHLRRAHEDYRFDKEGKKSAALERAQKSLTAAQHLLNSLLVFRDGAQDELIEEVIAACNETLQTIAGLSDVTEAAQ